MRRGQGVSNELRALRVLQSAGYAGIPPEVESVYNPRPVLPPAQTRWRPLPAASRTAHEVRSTGSTCSPTCRYNASAARSFPRHFSSITFAILRMRISRRIWRRLSSRSCRSTARVLYDCDFTQILGLPLASKDGRAAPCVCVSVDLTWTPNRRIDHAMLYGMAGSSCGGALVA